MSKIKINQYVNAAEILLYDVIGGWGINAKEFVNEIIKLEKNNMNITVRVNSPGGNVFDGLAICNRLKSSSSNITIVVDGIAASMASAIAMCGSKLIMADNARLMIHKPTVSPDNNDAEELRRTADLLDSLEGDLINMYANKSGMTAEAVKEQFMKPGIDTWLTAQQAYDLKLCDEISGSKLKNVAASIADFFAFEKTTNTNLNMNAELITVLKNNNIMIADEASLEDVNAAVVAVIKERNELLVSKTELLNKIKELSTQLDEVHEAKINEILDNAILQKRFTANMREHYAKLLHTDFETGKVIIEAMPAFSFKQPEQPVENPYKDWKFSDYQKAKNGAALLADLLEKDQAGFIKLYKDEFCKEPNLELYKRK